MNFVAMATGQRKAKGSLKGAHSFNADRQSGNLSLQIMDTDVSELS